MRRYVVRKKQALSGMLDWHTDIYMSDHSNLIDAIVEVKRRQKVNEIINHPQEFFIYDRKQDRNVSSEEIKEQL